MAQSGHGRPTIQTIAEELGVHRSTVSRALNPERSGLIGDETVRRVREVAKRLGWEANPWARSLSTNRSLFLGLLIPRLSDVVLATMFEAAEDQARDLGYQAVTVSTHDNVEKERELTEHLLERRVDGVVLATVHLEDTTPEYLSDNDVPFVLLNRGLSDHLSVRADNRLGGYLVTKHLLSQGHRRIGIVAGPLSVSTSVERLAGYRDALAEAAVDTDEKLVMESTFRADSGASAGSALLGLVDPPTAIFAVNDMTAVGVMRAAKDLGLHVPHDLAVVGFNDSDLARLLPTRLSSVSLPLEEMGRAAVRLLIDRILGKDVASEVFSPRLVVRESSGRVRQ